MGGNKFATRMARQGGASAVLRNIQKAPPVNGRASAIQEREFYSASGVSPSMPCRASWSQRRRLLILSRFARLGLFPLLPLSILQTLNPASLVQCNTISPLLLNPSENRTAPRLCSALIKSKNSCFFHSTSCFSISAFVSFFSGAFLSNAMYSGKSREWHQGKNRTPTLFNSLYC